MGTSWPRKEKERFSFPQPAPAFANSPPGDIFARHVVLRLFSSQQEDKVGGTCSGGQETTQPEGAWKRREKTEKRGRQHMLVQLWSSRATAALPQSVSQIGLHVVASELHPLLALPSALAALLQRWTRRAAPAFLISADDGAEFLVYTCMSPCPLKRGAKAARPLATGLPDAPSSFWELQRGRRGGFTWRECVWQNRELHVGRETLGYKGERGRFSWKKR